MKKIFTSAFILCTSIAGCHSAVESETHLSDSATSKEAFKLYDEPNADSRPDCDIFTSMELDSAKKLATLQNRLEGTCELAVTPNIRTYRLSKKEDNCGSVIYRGKTKSSSIEIVDNRKNTCEIPIVAAIVVKETSRKGTAHLYSSDSQAARNSNSQKFYCSGVGGTDEWTLYVDLEKKLGGFFDNDTTVVVPLTETKSLETLPPQELYIFEGKDTGSGDDKLRISFNKTTLSGSLILAPGTTNEKTLRAENRCIADDDIDLDL